MANLDMPRGVIATDSDAFVSQDMHVQHKPRKGRVDVAAALMEKQGGFWFQGSFYVPILTPDSRGQDQAPFFKKQFAEKLEGEKYHLKVHHITNPTLYRGGIPVPGDLKKYEMWAWVSRRPEVMKLSVPDAYVPMLQRLGLKLKD